MPGLPGAMAFHRRLGAAQAMACHGLWGDICDIWVTYDSYDRWVPSLGVEAAPAAPGTKCLEPQGPTRCFRMFIGRDPLG